jgi:cytochrome P450
MTLDHLPPLDQPEAHIDVDPASPEFQRDPHAAWARLRSTCPVARGPGWWALTRYADIVTVATDDRTFTSTFGVNARGGIIGPPRLPMHFDPPQQTQFRRVMNEPFLAERVAPLESEFRRLARTLLEPLVEQRGGELIAQFTSPFTTQCLGAFLHVPDALMAELSDGIERFEANVTIDTTATDAASEAMYQHARTLVALRQANPLDPRTDLITTLLQARLDGERMDPEAVAGTLRLVYIAGHIAPKIAIGSCILYLASHPALQAQLRDNPTLVADAVEELLRLETPNAGFARQATRDVTIGGQLIKQGERVALVFTSGDRDAAVFEEPDAFRLDRDRVAGRHLAFGHGAHKCPGAALSRLEMRVALEEVLAATAAFELAGEPAVSGWALHGPTRLPIALQPA